MIRKEHKENNYNLQNASDKDRKYSDHGRDGDYSREPDTSIEEGDEDYDDETQNTLFNEKQKRGDKHL